MMMYGIIVKNKEKGMENLFIFDVDDVICDLKFIIHKALLIETGQDIHYNDWYSFNLDKVYNVDMKVIMDAFFKHDILRNGQLNTNIHSVIDYLNQEKVKTMALTARGWNPEGNEITRIYFEENKINIPTLKVIEHHESKSKIISNLRDHRIIGFIDDNPRHILETEKECGSHVNQYILKNQPWNKSTEISSKVLRIDELTELPAIIDKSLKNTKIRKFKM